MLLELARLLQAWAGGDAQALESLWPRVYEDLKQLARRQLYQAEYEFS